jgi:hypothetical protein
MKGKKKESEYKTMWWNDLFNLKASDRQKGFYSIQQC